MGRGGTITWYASMCTEPLAIYDIRRRVRLALLLLIVAQPVHLGCGPRASLPRTETVCVVTLPDGSELHCSAPERAYEGGRCTCAAEVGGGIGQTYLGRVRTRVVEGNQPRP